MMLFSECSVAFASVTPFSRFMVQGRRICQLCIVCSPQCIHRHINTTHKHARQDTKKKDLKQRKKKPSKLKLPHAKIPKEWREISHNSTDMLMHAPCLGEDLSRENYKERFTHLLHLEEIQEEISMKYFDMKNVKFRDDGELLNLYVPAIDAGNLVVTRDDQIIVTNSFTDMPQQLATVKKVHNGNLQLRFSKEFREQYIEDLPEWNISFILNRISLRRCHRGVQNSSALGKYVLFPDAFNLQPAQLVIKSDDELYNPNLNKQQRTAVRQIVAGESRPLPYILFGPPGTGKTVTVVEAILQIYTRIPNSRILVCAPSNSAVNLLAIKLHESGEMNTRKMARHVAAQLLEDGESIPQSVRPYCTVVESIGQAFKYRIVLTTCNSAGFIYSLGLKVGHYTHVVIDEAGQATEPESLIPALLVSSTEGQIVLSGDPHQLGPVVLSGIAQQFGLDISLLERLIELPLYRRSVDTCSQQGSYNPLLVTKLVNNFRSHPCILKPSSVMFYHDELLAEGAIATTHSLCNWEYLPVQGVPLIFHGIQGTEQTGLHIPSRCNEEEADVVLMYLKYMFNTIEDLKEEHIGVITPYRLQVEILQEKISRQLYKNIDVGTVETFQGQERRIIIISTVRSSDETTGPERSLLGFLVNPRRFNVSISRAQALLIVIGNPSVLEKDDVTRFWREEREEGAIYNAYLKKVTYHTLSENEHKGSNEFSHLMWETQKYRVIKAGTLEKLVEYLYIKGEMDSTYTTVFLATYRTFSSTEEVIDILVERYINIKANKETKNELQDIQLKTIKSVLSVWIDTYPEDFRDPPTYPCLSKLEKFARQHIPESDLCIRVKHKIDKFRKEDIGKSDTNIEFHFNLVEEVDHLIVADYHKPLTFSNIPNQAVAEQLTFRDAELFKRVVPHQCLGAVWARRARKQGKGGTVAGSVLATIDQFNRVSLRVIATILKNADLKTSQRVKILQKWIEIAQEMRHLKNFSSLKAIISGLQTNSVYRLRKTWGALPKESLAVFEELSEIFSNENNQLASRNLLMKEATAKFPDVDSANKTLQRRNRMKRQSWIDNGVVQGTVPYLGTFLTDLTMIDTAIPDTTDSLINFEKRRKEFEVLAQIKLLQSASQIYTFREDSQFWSWFDAVRVYDENESYDLSCAIEPAADGGAKLKKKTASSISQRPGKIDSNRFSLFMCGGLNLDDKSSVASSSNLDSPVSPNAGLSHSSSTSSIQSYDSDNTTPFKSSDACVIKVSLETGATPKSHVYKSIMLHNTDHTNTVIQIILDKYDIKGKEKDYCLLQALPDGELLIPEKANVFYAMNNNGDYTFVLRTKKEQDTLTQSKKRNRRRLKLSLS